MCRIESSLHGEGAGKAPAGPSTIHVWRVLKPFQYFTKDTIQFSHIQSNSRLNNLPRQGKHTWGSLRNSLICIIYSTLSIYLPFCHASFQVALSKSRSLYSHPSINQSRNFALSYFACLMVFLSCSCSFRSFFLCRKRCPRRNKKVDDIHKYHNRRR